MQLRTRPYFSIIMRFTPNFVIDKFVLILDFF